MTVQKLPAFTLLDVTVSSPAEMIAAITTYEQSTLIERTNSWAIWRLPSGRYRLTVWGKPAGTYHTRRAAEAICDRLMALEGRRREVVIG